MGGKIAFITGITGQDGSYWEKKFWPTGWR